MNFTPISKNIIYELLDLHRMNIPESALLFLLVKKNNENEITEVRPLERYGGCWIVPGTNVDELYSEYLSLSKDEKTIVGYGLVLPSTLTRWVNRKHWPYKSVVRDGKIVCRGYGGTFMDEMPLLVVTQDGTGIWYTKDELNTAIGYVPHEIK